MSTPILWIFFPFVIGIILFFLRRWYRTTVFIGSVTTILLAISAWLLPINQLIRLGPVVFKIEESFNILGRQLTLGVNERDLVLMIFALTAIWFCAAFEARAGRMFVPIGLIMVALWIAALAVEPFLYAALILELAVLLSVLILAPPGKQPPRGVIRYLILQTFGMPFILFTGWLLAGVEASPGDLDFIQKASMLLGLGFLFLLAIFPFHTWQPMLAEEIHPYTAGFIFFFLPLMVTLYGLSFIDHYAWLRLSATTYELLRLAGVMMMAIGGIWAALQRHLGRIMGFAVLVSTGTLLLSISVSPNLDLFFAMQVPRVLAFALWSLALSTLRNKLISQEVQIREADSVTSPKTITPSGTYHLLRFLDIAGIGREAPVATAAMALAVLSLAGYPMLSTFPFFQNIWYHLSLKMPLLAFLSILGCISLGFGGLRSAAVLVMGNTETRWRFNENWVTVSFLLLGILLNLLIGLFPHWVLPLATKISLTFSQLATLPGLP